MDKDELLSEEDEPLQTYRRSRCLSKVGVRVNK